MVNSRLHKSSVQVCQRVLDSAQTAVLFYLRKLSSVAIVANPSNQVGSLREDKRGNNGHSGIIFL